MIHVSRYLSALVTLILAYGGYALAVAPWFEPPPIQRKVKSSEPSPPPLVTADEELKSLFPEDHWVRKNPKIFETDLCKLLIQDYRPLPDGHLELKPCVLVFYSGGRKTAATYNNWLRVRPSTLVLVTELVCQIPQIAAECLCINELSVTSN